MINRVVLVGRITKEVDLRVTGSNISVVQFTLAVNRNYTSANGEKQADFISCVAWRNTADFMKKYVRKGALLGIEGRIQTRNYEDSNGQTRYVTEVQADSVQILESKNDTSQSNEYDTKPSRDEDNDDYYNTSKNLVADEDLPF
ncbi:single-stranded DNA-binding protein [Acholeplasma hippikon]|uniref:Single-stranded DNA-binding protein n=1 Tax=Acholeplasma hippikon TaxID=264636 RepID=A0A449BKD9_9MOLU|nr:single-stranded DNA-binding protein [Acholeplasma hippikon]VEU82902.1 single strand binding protein [Acholeplasma hippikon]